MVSTDVINDFALFLYFILKDFAFSCYSLKLINFLVYATVLLDGTQKTPFPDFQGPTPSHLPT